MEEEKVTEEEGEEEEEGEAHGEPSLMVWVLLGALRYLEKRVSVGRACSGEDGLLPDGLGDFSSPAHPRHGLRLAHPLCTLSPWVIRARAPGSQEALSEASAVETGRGDAGRFLGAACGFLEREASWATSLLCR